MKLTMIAIDLAKNVFQIHGADERGRPLVRKQLKRDQMAAYFANLAPCQVGMEACGSAHYWARKLQAMGHTVRIIAPQFVKPFVKSNKNDRADAEAICEAMSRPTMRFVAVKTVEQQVVLSLHRVRQGYIKARTAQANRIRGLLAEFGVIIPVGINNVPTQAPGLMALAGDQVPQGIRTLIDMEIEHFKLLDQRAQQLDLQIKSWHRDDEVSRRIEEIPGIGPITASALTASVGDARTFKNGRQLSAWLGLVPKQHSSGGKENLLGISKRGDVYLRTLLIHGARSVIYAHNRKPNQPDSWLTRLIARSNPNVAAVALANKMARTAWALMAYGSRFRPDYAAGAAGRVIAAAA